MSFLSAKKASPQSAAIWPSYTGLQLQTAANVLPIPLLWGMNKVAPNIIFYGGFHAVPQFSYTPSSGGKGGVFGGGGGGSWQLSGWTYAADLMMALCEGPVVGINQVYQGQSVYGAQFTTTGASYGGAGAGQATVSGGGSGLSSIGVTLFDGSTPQPVWGYLSAAYPADALAYPGTAFVAAASFGLGSDASIGTLSFEAQGRFYGSGANGLDADPAQVVADFLVNPLYGVGFPGANIDATTVYGAGNDASLQTYCKAMGLAFSPFLNQTETASSILTRWLQLLVVAPVWSGKVLRFIPYGDEPITGNGATFLPNVSPTFALGDADLVYSAGDDPIKVSRLDPYSLPNLLRVEALNRTGVTSGQGLPEYQATPIEARDQAMIEQFGLRVGSTITAHEICDLNVATVVAQTLLQRGLYVRATYKFALSWEFCLLDPMDVVTLTDANLGLLGALARIVEIEEDDSGLLSITAEELVIGVSTPAANPSGAAGGNSINAGVQAQPVNSPLIFEPPPQLSNNTAEIWLGASGGAGGAADPNWGGAYVYASLDDVSYQKIATIQNPLRQGFLTAPLAAASGYDSADVLAVNLAESAGTLSTSTEAAALAGQTLCLVDGELLGLATATLSSTYNYNLTGLARGMYGTASSAHSIGAPFARLDGAVVQYALPSAFIGVTIYLKFQSFNVFGGGVEPLSNCVVYTYIPSGAGAIGPVATSLLLGQAQDWGLTSTPASVFDQFGAATAPVYASIDLGSASP
ncbi:MAG TPA: phage tail protein [Methylocystis sp.]|nr:phage tail protein [Methylocystis sp.]